ncbi:plasmid mobilization protein [Candidatus Burkholderia verschuerenii]|nr:plasmid mobilization relaxosome protein MobC [Candidatus Burkholderia verschuerenii]
MSDGVDYRRAQSAGAPNATFVDESFRASKPVKKDRQMPRKPSLQTYVSEETKAKFAAAAKKHGYANEAQLLRVVIDRVIGDEPAPPPRPVREAKPKREQINIGLTPDEHYQVESRAKQQGVNRTTWIVNLIRAHVLREPQFSTAELDTLMESNRQIAAVGRNLNQIARNINMDPNAMRSVTLEAIETLVADLKQHRAHVARVMDTNLDRWGLDK